jgi:hypothetical protein
MYLQKLSAHMVETGGRIIPLSADEVKSLPEKQQMLEDIMNSTLPACVESSDYDENDNKHVGNSSSSTNNNSNDSSSVRLKEPFRAQAIISNPVT